MAFKDISYLELLRPFCSAERNHTYNICKRHYEEQFCEIILNLDQMVQEKISSKDISYLELWQPLCLVELNHLCNFGWRHHEENFCEIILILGQWFRKRCPFKIFLIWSSGGPSEEGSHCEILEEGILRNNSVKLF